MEFRKSSFNYVTSKEPGQTAREVLEFSRPVRSVAVGMIGYSATFEGNDHHLGRLTMELNASIDGGDNTKVNVSGRYALRDWSGEFDDNYSGNLQWVVIAELEPITAPSPGDARGDLNIQDAEITQAIQHFKSADHLDAANVFPDNSIQLVANKPTVVRLYIDYDNNSGLPPISRVSGEIEIMSGGVLQTITALNTIVPRRVTTIDRGNVGHTLNFLIPDSVSVGMTSFKAKVFDTTDTTQFSGEFQRPLNFTAIPALPVIAIGVKYTGNDVNDGATDADLEAPLMSDFVTVFGFTDKVFPIPNVNITSYDTIEYDKDIESDISSGGCDKFGDLLDVLDDFQGDSSDIVYGMVNSGVNTGSVGGCGRSGVAAGRINGQGTAAHELGHALGRQHAPCDNVTRCAEPANTDGDYPNYSGYDSDSIGEYGFDGTGPNVRSPATSHDFMGYSGGRWVSPYTYKALFSRIPATFSSASAALITQSSTAAFRTTSDNEWIRKKSPTLFLRLDIEKNRELKFHPSFIFDSYPKPHGDSKTDFSLVFMDKNGKSIRSVCLYSDTGCSCCGCNNAPKFPLELRQAVSLPDDAYALAIFECEEELFRKEIDIPPKLDVSCTDSENKKSPYLNLTWKLNPNSKEDNYTYLVQWQDRFGTWRGCAPRTPEKKLRIKKSLWGRQKLVALRVLATAGFGTTVSYVELKCEHAPSKHANETDSVIQLVGIPLSLKGSIAIPSVIKAIAINSDTNTDAEPDIRWYNDNGAEISRGSSLDLRNLNYGETLVTAFALDTGKGKGTNQWLIERNKKDQYRILQGTVERPRKEATTNC